MSKDFQIRLMEPKTLTWWNNKRNNIDMSPPYQRQGRLWSPTDKAYLIDTIINGYDVPKIYVADYTWGNSPLNTKKMSYAIIDGKQRFEAIFDFFDGTVVLNDDFIYLDNPSLKLAGLGYKDLQKYTSVIDEIHNYPLTIMGVYTNDEKTISELFLRLNRSKPLTGAEIRNAMSGPAVDVIRQIASHDFFTENIKFEIKRGQHQNAAGKLLLFEYYSDFRETIKTNLDSFVQDIKEEDKDRLELSGRRVIDNLNSMNSIFLPKDTILNSAGIIPVYYWFVRNINEYYYPHIREFLSLFEKERRINRQNIKDNPNNIIKSVLIEYDNYNRSTNTEVSHRERYRILKTLFETYIETGSF